MKIKKHFSKGNIAVVVYLMYTIVFIFMANFISSTWSQSNSSKDKVNQPFTRLEAGASPFDLLSTSATLLYIKKSMDSILSKSELTFDDSLQLFQHSLKLEELLESQTQ